MFYTFVRGITDTAASPLLPQTNCHGIHVKLRDAAAPISVTITMISDYPDVFVFNLESLLLRALPYIHPKEISLSSWDSMLVRLLPSPRKCVSCLIWSTFYAAASVFIITEYLYIFFKRFADAACLLPIPNSMPLCLRLSNCYYGCFRICT